MTLSPHRKALARISDLLSECLGMNSARGMKLTQEEMYDRIIKAEQIAREFAWLPIDETPPEKSMGLLG